MNIKLGNKTSVLAELKSDSLPFVKAEYRVSPDTKAYAQTNLINSEIGVSKKLFPNAEIQSGIDRKGIFVGGTVDDVKAKYHPQTNTISVESIPRCNRCGIEIPSLIRKII